MKYRCFLLLVVGLAGCGQQTIQAVVGPAGPQGATGPSGANGLSIVSATTPDISGHCSAGGNVILMAQDSLGTGAWSPQDSDQSSIVVCNGVQGATGATGSSGAQGATGPTGSQGVAGATGASGSSGTNANLSVVQFCSQYVTTYPSSFPEFGLCEDNSIYAVYWDGKNAWLAEVVPGYYASTSTSAPCNFTVGANCSVSN